MNRPILLTGLFLVLMVLSCASGTAVKSNEAVDTADTAEINGLTNSGESAELADIMGRDWVLAEFKINNIVTRIERPEALSESFFINFEEGRVSGIAAPNRYFGPYTHGEGNALSFGALATTMMASFIEVEALKEHEYFAFLDNVTGWSLLNETLELFTTNESGDPAVLVYR